MSDDKKETNGVVSTIMLVRWIATAPVLIVSGVLVFMEQVVWAFAGLFVVVSIIAICRLILDSKFDDWKIKRHRKDE